VAEAIAMMNVTAIPAVVRVTRRYPTAPKTIARADAAGALKKADGRRSPLPLDRSTPCNIE